MMTRVWSALLLGVVMLGGCAGVNNGRPSAAGYQDAIVAAMVEKYSRPDAIPADQGRMTEKQRNQILDELIFLTDVNYYNFETELYQGRALFDTSTDLAILGLGAAGGIITNSGTQAIIAAISGGIGGSRVSINKNYFHDSSTQALIAKMQASRKGKLETMRKAMATLSTADYSLARGLADLTEYYNAGTIIGALQNIVADSGAEARKSDAELKKLIEGRFARTAAGDTLRSFWKPDGTTIDKGNEQRLVDWMKINGFATGPGTITMFLRSELLEEARAKAARDLKLTTE